MICYLTTATYFLYFFIVLYYTFFFQSITLAQSYLHVSIPRVDPFSFTSPNKVVVNSAGNALTFLNLMPNLSCVNCSGCQLVHAPVSVLLFFFLFTCFQVHIYHISKVPSYFLSFLFSKVNSPFRKTMCSKAFRRDLCELLKWQRTELLEQKMFS